MSNKRICIKIVLQTSKQDGVTRGYNTIQSSCQDNECQVTLLGFIWHT